MKQYDLAFSLGAACSCSQSLREAGLQFASYPFDWVGCPSILASVAALESEFADWFRKEDLKLIDVRREPLSTRCYVNRCTGFSFYHEFSLFGTFEGMFGQVAEQFCRRQTRLLNGIRAAKSVLAVYVEVPFRAQGSDGDFCEAQRRLAAKFPGTAVDLLVFKKVESGRSSVVREVGPGVTVVELDFVQYVDGEMSHQVNRIAMTDYLTQNFTVTDLRTDSEKRHFAQCKSKERAAKWGADSFLARFYNAVSYKFYRKLEKYLIRQGIVPQEKPIRY